MSTSYQAKVSQVLARQLDCQEINVVCNAVAGTSDAPSIIAIDNSSIAATVITLTVGELVEKVFSVQVHNRITGAVVAISAAPSLLVAGKISVTCNGTAQTDLAVCLKYKVQE